jgi:hypothetical protein
MRWMFQCTAAFNQNLCSWGQKAPTSVAVTYEFDGATMFENSGCPLKDSPDTSNLPVGPWCHSC